MGSTAVYEAASALGYELNTPTYAAQPPSLYAASAPSQARLRAAYHAPSTSKFTTASLIVMHVVVGREVGLAPGRQRTVNTETSKLAATRDKGTGGEQPPNTVGGNTTRGETAHRGTPPANTPPTASPLQEEGRGARLAEVGEDPQTSA